MSTLPELTNATLLIVDDVPANLGVIVEFLEGYGFRVVVAQDGEEALRRIEFAPIDLVLLDVMMPGIDGFETCRRLKAKPAMQDVPVIFMTALADTDSKVTGFAAGGVDYVTKPFQFAEVLARVNTHLALRAMQQQRATQTRQLQQAYDELKETHARLAAAQLQLVQSEQMASIGLLAAGVAHEINNPLGFVSSNVECLADGSTKLLQVIAAYAQAEEVLATAAPQQLAAIRQARQAAEMDYLSADTPHLIEETRSGLHRVKKIVEDLQDFSHVGETPWQFADLNLGLESTLNLLAGTLKDKITVLKNYGQLPELNCRPLELNQAFMNLLLNAAQAIPAQGEVRIASGSDEHEVWVEIADNGVGIDPAHLARIFDPFFTTKPVGQGTGLGLSLAYATVQKHGGRIDVESAPGQGATFRIHLPRQRAAAAT